MRRISLLLGVLCASAFASTARVAADDLSEVERLRSEVTALRDEVAQLRKERDALKAELRKTKPAGTERSEGALNGIQWEISVINKQGVAVGATTFYAQDGKIMKDGKPIGSYSDAGNRARMDITDAPVPKANGTYSLLRVKNDPPTYDGMFKNKDGVEIRVLLRALID